MEAKPQPGDEDQWSTRRFYKEMRKAIHNKSRGYQWYKEYAMTHRNKLINIATGHDNVSAYHAAQIIKDIPREPTSIEKLQGKIRQRFQRWRTYIINRLPDKIGPFRIP